MSRQWAGDESPCHDLDRHCPDPHGARRLEPCGLGLLGPGERRARTANEGKPASEQAVEGMHAPGDRDGGADQALQHEEQNGDEAQHEQRTSARGQGTQLGGEADGREEDEQQEIAQMAAEGELDAEGCPRQQCQEGRHETPTTASGKSIRASQGNLARTPLPAKSATSAMMSVSSSENVTCTVCITAPLMRAPDAPPLMRRLRHPRRGTSPL